MKWLAIISSSIIGALLFIYPSFLYGVSFLFLIPLFCAVFADYRVSFKEGLAWGFIFFGCHLYAILVLLHESAEGYARYAGYGALVIYLSLYTALWCGLTYRFSRSSLFNHPLKRAILWIITTNLYFIYIDRYALWVLGNVHGYTPGNPLLALVHAPVMLYMLPYIGMVGYFIILVAAQAMIAMAIVHVSKAGASKASRWLVGIAIVVYTMTPYCINNISLHATIPSYVEKIGYVYPPAGSHDMPWEKGEEIAQALFECRRQHPEVALLIMPESSCKFALNQHPKLIQSWIDTVLHDECILLIGSHRKESGQLYNCLYSIQHGPIILTYDKQLPIPFGEYIPHPWKKIQGLHNLFLANKESFCAGTVYEPFVFDAPVSFTCIPQICYEVYCASFDPGKRVCHDQTAPLLVVSNDSWYKRTPYYQDLLFLIVRYQALAWNRSIIYAAHTGGWWLGTRGGMHTFKRKYTKQLNHKKNCV